MTPNALAGFHGRPVHDPALAEILASFRRPRMPSSDVRFALVREPTNPLAMPVAYPMMSDLARAIDVDRAGAAIELQDNVPLNIRDWGEVFGVAVWTLGEGGDRHRYLGWAWLDGGGRGPLEAALHARCSTAPTIGRARQGRAAA
jgi:hypothetical protein